jgi:hypothetical protein
LPRAFQTPLAIGFDPLTKRSENQAPAENPRGPASFFGRRDDNEKESS